MLEEAIDLPIASAPRPSPIVPAPKLDLLPQAVREMQRSRKASEQKASLATIAGCVYFTLVLLLALRVALLFIQCRRVESDLAAHAAQVTEIKTTASRWNSLEEAIDPETYPAELLLRCARLLPSDGVRFTLFETKTGKVTIEGEAKNAPTAFKFGEDLRKDKDLGNSNGKCRRRHCWPMTMQNFT